jgi:hypothetical protein
MFERGHVARQREEVRTSTRDDAGAVTREPARRRAPPLRTARVRSNGCRRNR